MDYASTTKNSNSVRKLMGGPTLPDDRKMWSNQHSQNWRLIDPRLLLDFSSLVLRQPFGLNQRRKGLLDSDDSWPDRPCCCWNFLTNIENTPIKHWSESKFSECQLFCYIIRLESKSQSNRSARISTKILRSYQEGYAN
jgi:hypothetical protein